MMHLTTGQIPMMMLSDLNRKTIKYYLYENAVFPEKLHSSIFNVDDDILYRFKCIKISIAIKI